MNNPKRNTRIHYNEVESYAEDELWRYAPATGRSMWPRTIFKSLKLQLFKCFHDFFLFFFDSFLDESFYSHIHG